MRPLIYGALGQLKTTVTCTEEMPVASGQVEAWNLIFPTFHLRAQKLSKWELLDWKLPTYNVLEADVPVQFQTTVSTYANIWNHCWKTNRERSLPGIYSVRKPQYLSHTELYPRMYIFRKGAFKGMTYTQTAHFGWEDEDFRRRHTHH